MKIDRVKVENNGVEYYSTMWLFYLPIFDYNQPDCKVLVKLSSLNFQEAIRSRVETKNLNKLSRLKFSIQILVEEKPKYQNNFSQNGT